MCYNSDGLCRLNYSYLDLTCECFIYGIEWRYNDFITMIILGSHLRILNFQDDIDHTDKLYPESC